MKRPQNLKQFPTWFDVHIVNVKSSWRLFQIFVALLVNMNFTYWIRWKMSFDGMIEAKVNHVKNSISTHCSCDTFHRFHPIFSPLSNSESTNFFNENQLWLKELFWTNKKVVLIFNCSDWERFVEKTRETNW